MFNEGEIVIPVNTDTQYDDIVKSLRGKLTKKNHPTIKLAPLESYPEPFMIGILFLLMKAISSIEKTRQKKGLEQLEFSLPSISINSPVKKMEQEIEKIFKVAVVIDAGKKSVEKKIKNKENELALDEVFGLWKGKHITLDKVREAQWGKRR